ncbi:MAG TPA: hypothetical protein VD815_09720 [Candidatus Saccharimonadales bacterium]|nr:hypothetical protein [Candidatus Saccharimonadales bacterium]
MSLPTSQHLYLFQTPTYRAIITFIITSSWLKPCGFSQEPIPVADDSESSRCPDIFHLGPSSKCEWAVSDDNDSTITTIGCILGYSYSL